jgi:O-antigen/teichoic acid export membrane protein
LDRFSHRAEKEVPSPTGSAEAAQRRVLSMHTNALALFLNVVVSGGLGYLSWLLAARFAPPDAVGLAAAVVSAAVLCGNLAVLGLGISIITFLPRELREPRGLLNGFFTIVITSAFLCSVAFMVAAGTLMKHLHILVSNAALGTSFIALGIATSVVILLDGTSIALRRGDDALVRSTLAGIAKVALLVSAWLATALSATTLVAAWSITTIAACGLGYRQLRRSFPTYRFRPRISGAWARATMTHGLSNHLLYVSRFAPALAIPLVVTELLSPSENAYWYAAWMIAFLVRFIPGATAEASLAEITNRASSLAAGIGKNMWSSFVMSIFAMLALIGGAHWILALMGHRYAAAATTPLQLLALSILPQIFIETYLLGRRATMQLREPNIVFSIAAIASVAAAAYGAHAHGLVGVAAGWLIIETVAGTWAASRLIKSLRGGTRSFR